MDKYIILGHSREAKGTESLQFVATEGKRQLGTYQCLWKGRQRKMVVPNAAHHSVQRWCMGIAHPHLCVFFTFSPLFSSIRKAKVILWAFSALPCF